MRGPVTPEAQVSVLIFHDNIIRKEPSAKLKMSTVIKQPRIITYYHSHKSRGTQIQKEAEKLISAPFCFYSVFTRKVGKQIRTNQTSDFNSCPSRNQTFPH
jgi:hypothetical protein